MAATPSQSINQTSANPWLIAAAVMLATFMEILDTVDFFRYLAVLLFSCIALVWCFQRVKGKAPVSSQ